MKYILIIIVLFFIAGISFAKEVKVSAVVSVGAWYKCEIKGYDLVCSTNARNVIVNGKVMSDYKQ